jgi:T5SS/PEP-CTERM-associated repeat protein
LDCIAQYPQRVVGFYRIDIFLGIDMTRPWFGAALAAPRAALACGLGGTALAMVSLAGPARGGTPAWVGNASTDWFTAGNWNPAAVPTTTDDVTVDSTSPHTTAVNGGAAASQQIFVGAIGAGNLAITNGGSLATSSAGYLGFFANGAGVVTVDGAGSNWTNAVGLDVGHFGSGALTITHGGTVTSAGPINFGAFAGASGNVVVDGAGSGLSLNSAANFYVGAAGNGTLTISNGGTVTDINATAGFAAGATGSILVDGAGSKWITTNGLFLGYTGKGTLVISNGGTVTTTAAGIGAGIGGSGGSAVIDGAGSSWTLSAILYVGLNTNTTGSVAVTHGASLSTFNTAIGLNSSSNGSITVDGAGSSWTNGSVVSIGESGTGALTIANGGAVSVGGQVLIADQAGSNGALNIGAAPGAAAMAPGTLSAASVQFGAGIGAINFNHTAANYVFSPDISGAGAVNQLSGHTILTGNESYTGPTSVSGGTLSVNSSIASSSLTTVNTGGTLGGIGTIGNTVVNGGTLSPGNSIGSLTVQGNLVLTTAATYMVEVSGTTADKTVVTGSAQLGGKVLVALSTRIASTTSYTILTSSSTTGSFGSVSVSSPALARAHLSYAGNNVVLTLDPSLLSPALPGFSSINQRNVAAGIDNAVLGGVNLPPGFNALFNMNGARLGNALTQASGETATGAQQTTFDAMNLFTGLMTDPFTAGRGDDGGSAAMGYARTDPRNANAMFAKTPQRLFESRWNMWAAGYGGSQTTNGNSTLGSNDATSRIGGVAVGTDYWFSPNTMAGFAMAGGGTNFSVNGQGSGRSDLFQAGAFVRHTEGNAYITAAVAYGWQDITTDRTVTIAGVDQLHANFKANALSGRVEGGNRYATPWLGITPYAAAQSTTFYLPGYGEQSVAGTNTFALNYAGRDVTATRSELGLRADKSYALQAGILTLRGRAAWAHDFDADRAVSATFQILPGANFVVNGAARASDAALATGSAEVKWLNGFSLTGAFEGEFSKVTRSYAGKGALRYQW